MCRVLARRAVATSRRNSRSAQYSAEELAVLAEAHRGEPEALCEPAAPHCPPAGHYSLALSRQHFLYFFPEPQGHGSFGRGFFVGALPLAAWCATRSSPKSFIRG
jgi:hypothetical protein